MFVGGTDGNLLTMETYTNLLVLSIFYSFLFSIILLNVLVAVIFDAWGKGDSFIGGSVTNFSSKPALPGVGMVESTPTSSIRWISTWMESFIIFLFVPNESMTWSKDPDFPSRAKWCSTWQRASIWHNGLSWACSRRASYGHERSGTRSFA